MQIFLLIVTFGFAIASQAEKVLYIGDSHSVGAFGRKLDQLIRDRSETELATYASCGSTASWFYSGQATSCGAFQRKEDGSILTANKFPTPKILDLLEKHRPDLVIVALGTNYGLNMGNQKTEAFVASEIKKIVHDIEVAGARCIWVSHPKTKRFAEVEQKLYVLIEKAIANKCKLVNSLELTAFPESCSDGLHYNCKAGIPIAQEWAKKAFTNFYK